MKNKIIFAILISIVFIASLFLIKPDTRVGIVFALSSTPDSYGNRIVMVYAKQWNGSAWVLFNDTYKESSGSWTWDGTNIKPDAGSIDNEYVTNQTWWRVVDCGVAVGTGCTYPMEFFFLFALNQTLAPDLATAKTYVEAYTNITNGGGYTLTNAASTSKPAGEYTGTTYYNIYLMYLWNVSSHPASGSTYAMSVRYTAFL